MKRELDRTEGTTERKNDTEKFNKSKQIAQTGHKRKKSILRTSRKEVEKRRQKQRDRENEETHAGGQREREREGERERETMNRCCSVKLQMGQ